MRSPEGIGVIIGLITPQKITRKWRKSSPSKIIRSSGIVFPPKNDTHKSKIHQILRGLFFLNMK